MPDYVLEGQSLCFSYGDRRVLADASFVLQAGERLALTGPNGSGKTTLFRCLTGLTQLEKGRIVLAGQEIRTERDFQFLRRKVGYALQNADDQLIFPTVLEDVCFGLLNLGCSEAEARVKAGAMLEKLGLGGYGDRLTYQLSGGQQKLVALACVLVMEPGVLLLDEPFNALDSAACARLCEILAAYGGAMIIVAHEASFLSRLCSRFLVMTAGRLLNADSQ